MKILAQNLIFEIPVSQFPHLLLALTKRIRELIKHQDFDPFKEKLRNKNPEKYSSLPFNFEGKTYYLYTKGIESNIDKNIRLVDGFIQLINDHQVESKPLKFSYK